MQAVEIALPPGHLLTQIGRLGLPPGQLGFEQPLCRDAPGELVASLPKGVFLAARSIAPGSRSNRNW